MIQAAHTWSSVTAQKSRMGWEVRGSLKREGTYVCLWPIHADVWQEPTQHCKTITFQLKIDLTKKEIYL